MYDESDLQRERDKEEERAAAGRKVVENLLVEPNTWLCFYLGVRTCGGQGRSI